jgi:hypothetical protein
VEPPKVRSEIARIDFGGPPMAVPFAAGPMVRIRFPPAESQQRTGAGPAWPSILGDELNFVISPLVTAYAVQAMFRAAARHGYRVLSSGRVGGAALLAEQYQVIKDAYRAEGVPLDTAHITVNRFAHITNSKEEGLRFAENARYQSRVASSLRRRQEVMQARC